MKEEMSPVFLLELERTLTLNGMNLYFMPVSRFSDFGVNTNDNELSMWDCLCDTYDVAMGDDVVLDLGKLTENIVVADMGMFEHVLLHHDNIDKMKINYLLATGTNNAAHWKEKVLQVIKDNYKHKIVDNHIRIKFE